MVPKGEAVVNPWLPGILCIAVVCVILSLGLWPFHVPANDVTWLGSRNGLRLGRHGNLIAVAPLTAVDDIAAGDGSVEVWLQAADAWKKGTFLSFSQLGHTVGLQMKQSQIDLALETTVQGRVEKLYVDEVFHPRKPRFITVTSGPSGAVVYVDGVPTKRAPHFHLSRKNLTGRLILGDSPGQTASWAGMLLGVAIYQGELAQTQVLEHYRNWTTTGRPETNTADDCVTLYLFEERSGRVVHSHAGPAGELQIPARYEVVDQKFLEPVWEEFSLSRSYGSAVFKNIVGFLPVGFFFYAYMAGVRGLRRAVLITVLSGALISLTIEVLQFFLPTRDSGTSDLITNTFGTWLGVVLYRRLQPTLAAMFPRLSMFPQPRD